MKKLGLLGLALALLFQPVSAQLPDFPPAVDANAVPQDGQELYYRGYVGGATFNNVIAGPYWGSYTATGPAFSMYCVDFNNYVNSVGDPWYINATSLGSSDMTQTRLGAGSLTTYQQTAFLSSLFAVESSSYWDAIHGAIWTLTLGYNPDNGSNGFVSGTKNDPYYWLNTELPTAMQSQSWATRDWSNWYVLTPTGADNSQEFLVHVTPEPATIILMGSGLLLIGVAARRRRRDEDVA